MSIAFTEQRINFSNKKQGK